MTRQKLKLKKGDTVIVTSGSDRGKIGEILKTFPDDSMLLISGINLRTHHKKPSSVHVGGKITKEAKIQVSNVAYYDSENKVPVKLGFKILDEGTKVRFNKRTGSVV